MKEDKNTTSLFQKANNGWRLINKDRWFGTTYQITCPSTWGRQTLNINLNHHFYKHIKRCMDNLEEEMDVRTEKNLHNIIGRHSIGHFSRTKHNNKKKNRRGKKFKLRSKNNTINNNKNREDSNDNYNSDYVRVYDNNDKENNYTNTTPVYEHTHSNIEYIPNNLDNNQQEIHHEPIYYKDNPEQLTFRDNNIDYNITRTQMST